MLTGQVTFAGDTVSDSIAKILERDAAWSALPATTPTAIRRLLLRCLTTDPNKRLCDMGDVRVEIDAIDEVICPSEDALRAKTLPFSLQANTKNAHAVLCGECPPVHCSRRAEPTTMGCVSSRRRRPKVVGELRVVSWAYSVK
jgi:hypothetical protein